MGSDLNNLNKFGLETGAAHESAVDIRLGEKFSGIGRSDRSTVKDAGGV